MSRHISYYTKGGTEYARIPGKSVRINGKPRKVKGTELELGKVIDKEHNVFCSKKRGIYTYNPDTGEFGTAPEEYTSEVREDKRKKVKVGLDFGGSFFLSKLIEKMKYSEVIDSIEYGNRDSLYTMIYYYTISPNVNSHADVWYASNYCNCLYPNANITSQRISDMLKSIGDPGKMHTFFEAHIKWIKKYVCNDPAVILDSTGLPNDIHFRLTAMSNHNGVLSNEARLTVPVQRDSGFPLLFRIQPGNTVDVSSLRRTIDEISNHGMQVDFVEFDAGYGSIINFDALLAANIDFVTRLSSKFSIYQDLIKNHAGQLKSKENIIMYMDRALYIQKFDRVIGRKYKREAFAYLICDVNRYSDELHKMLKNIEKGVLKVEQLHERLEKAGLFVLLATLPFETDGIMPAYYSRQGVEQYFDVSKGSAKLTPLRIHDEDRLRGHLILSMIASTINVYIQKKQGRVYDSSSELFEILQSQKCDRYKTRITIDDPPPRANEMYKLFKIELPISFNLNSKGLPVPKYDLPQYEEEQM